MDQIASILGDTSLSPDLIRSNLSHPRFLSNGSYNVECFVSAYFDGTLPDTSLEGNDTAIADQTTKPEQVLHERTAFDQMWDESKMRSGKKDLRQQEKISEDVKKSILALAEHDSDEEEEEDIEEHRRDGLRLVSMEE